MSYKNLKHVIPRFEYVITFVSRENIKALMRSRNLNISQN